MPAYILESHIRSVNIFHIETTIVGFILLHFVFPINYALSLVSGCKVKPGLHLFVHKTKWMLLLSNLFFSIEYACNPEDKLVLKQLM